MKKLLKSFLIPLIALVVGMPAYAYDDWQEMKEGVALSFPKGEFGGYFTLKSAQTVELTIVANSGWDEGFELYSSPSLGTPLTNSIGWTGPGTYTLEAGTYYFYCNSTWGTGTIKYSIVQELVPTIDSVIPEDGSIIGPSANDGFLSLTCNFTIYAESWKLVSDNYTSAIHNLDTNAQGILQSLSIYIGTEINNLFDHGLVAGDEFQIVVEGVKDYNNRSKLYGDDGTLTINYTLGQRAIDLVSTSLDKNNPNLLLSYYLPGDKSSLMSFTFSGAFDTTHEGQVTQIIQNKQSNKTLRGPILELACCATSNAMKLYYTGTYSDDNRTVTFDISGFDFGTWDGALCYDKDNEVLPSIKIFNVYDTDGFNSIGCSESNPGSYSFSTDYRQYQQASFDCTWTPEAGGKLTNQTSVNITTQISVDDKTGVKNRIRGFESVLFSAADGTEVAVPFSQCTFNYTNESLGQLTISCPTPASVKDLNNVTVKVKGLVICDGWAYSENAISADFNPLYIDPSPFITFGSAGTDGIATKSDYANSISIIHVYTDLILGDTDYPTLTCSTGVNCSVNYVNTTPSTDDNGDKYYSIYFSPSIGLTSDNGATAVPSGTTLTISFPARCFSSNISPAVYDGISHTFTIQDEPLSATLSARQNIGTPGSVFNYEAEAAGFSSAPDITVSLWRQCYTSATEYTTVPVTVGGTAVSATHGSTTSASGSLIANTYETVTNEVTGKKIDFYVKVEATNGTQSTTAMSGGFPFASLVNSSYANEFKIEEGTVEFRVETAFTADQVTYERTLKATNVEKFPGTLSWQPWFMPFDVTFAEAADFVSHKGNSYEILKFNKVEGSVVYFEQINQTGSASDVAMSANIPYIFLPTETGDKKFSFDQKAINPTADATGIGNGDWRMFGNYSSITMGTDDEADSYALSNGTFSKATLKSTLPPFRVRLKKVTLGSSAPARMQISRIDSATSGEEEMMNDFLDGMMSGDAVIYDMQGRRVTNPGRGMFIINGRKVVIR